MAIACSLSYYWALAMTWYLLICHISVPIKANDSPTETQIACCIELQIVNWTKVPQSWIPQNFFKPNLWLLILKSCKESKLRLRPSLVTDSRDTYKFNFQQHQYLRWTRHNIFIYIVACQESMVSSETAIYWMDKFYIQNNTPFLAAFVNV